MKHTTVEEIELERTIREFGSERARWYFERSVVGFMRPAIKVTKVGKRPVGRQSNERLLQVSPGSSRFYGLDFVKAVYAETTGQEPEVF